jgi:hypothetical protein
MMKSDEYITVEAFSKYAADQIETTQMLVELLNGFITLWVNTLPPQVRASVGQTSMNDEMRRVRETVEKLRSAWPKSDPEGESGPIQ